MADFPEKLWKLKGIFKWPEKNKYPLRILCGEKISFKKEGEIKRFSDERH